MRSAKSTSWSEITLKLVQTRLNHKNTYDKSYPSSFSGRANKLLSFPQTFKKLTRQKQIFMRRRPLSDSCTTIWFVLYLILFILNQHDLVKQNFMTAAAVRHSKIFLNWYLKEQNVASANSKELNLHNEWICKKESP